MDEELTIREHIAQLRLLLLMLFVPLLILFVLFFWLAGYFVPWLLNYMGLDITNVVALTPFENLSARITIALSLTIFFGLPIIFAKIYGYVKPAISQKNRKKLTVVVSFSIMLGIIGVIIGILVFAKFMLFMLSTNYILVNPMWSITSVVRYIIIMALTMAFILQLVLIIPILIKSELINIEDLTNHRGIIFILVAVISALISPPDPFSMFLMIIPIHGSFEIGILISKIQKKLIK
ncbi:MAG: twin-arginine translocase subunit TatC [Candidatus Woesearchaeota archaeon]